MYNNKFCGCWGSNRAFLLSETTALPTEPQPMLLKLQFNCPIVGLPKRHCSQTSCNHPRGGNHLWPGRRVGDCPDAFNATWILTRHPKYVNGQKEKKFNVPTQKRTQTEKNRGGGLVVGVVCKRVTRLKVKA